MDEKVLGVNGAPLYISLIKILDYSLRHAVHGKYLLVYADFYSQSNAYISYKSGIALHIKCNSPY